MIPVYKPRIFKSSAISAIESGWISSHGEFISKATDALQDFFNIPYVILMNNGTSSTHMLIKALQFKYPEIKKIYVPNHVFVAVWNVVLYEKEYDMKVLDMDPTSLNMRVDEPYIKSLEKNSAVLIVHNIGNIVNVPRLKKIRPDIIFIEDNCEGLFGKYEGLYSGMSDSSLCSSCSFFGNKIITSGEGGAFFTHDKDLYAHIYSTVHHGLGPKQFIFSTLGYNYRMTNVQAALLYDQMNNIKDILSDKDRVFNLYNTYLQDERIVKPSEEPNTLSSKWMFVCGIKLPYSNIHTHMKNRDIDIRPFFYDIQTHTHLNNVERNTMELQHTFIMLPSYPDLEESQIKFISDSLIEILDTGKEVKQM